MDGSSPPRRQLARAPLGCALLLLATAPALADRGDRLDIAHAMQREVAPHFVETAFALVEERVRLVRRHTMLPPTNPDTVSVLPDGLALPLARPDHLAASPIPKAVAAEAAPKPRPRGLRAAAAPHGPPPELRLGKADGGSARQPVMLAALTRLTRPAAPQIPALPDDAPLPNAGNLRDLVAKRAREEGVPLALAHGVVMVESRYNPKATGQGRYIGLTQISYETARSIGYIGTRAGLYDPATNLKFGMRYLGMAYRQAKGDMCLTVSKYQGGHRVPGITRAGAVYCSKVKQHIAALKRETPARPATRVAQAATR